MCLVCMRLAEGSLHTLRADSAAVLGGWRRTALISAPQPWPAPRRWLCAGTRIGITLLISFKGMGCQAYDLCRGSGTVLLSRGGRAARRRALFDGPFSEARMDRVAQPSRGEASYGRAEAPEYTGIPSQNST